MSIPYAGSGRTDSRNRAGAAGDSVHRMVEVRHHLWLDSRDLSCPQASHWLWLALSDGRVLAFEIIGDGIPDDRCLPTILAAIRDDPRGLVQHFGLPGGLVVGVRYAAPVLPVAGQRHAGWLARSEVRAFTQNLDYEVWGLLSMLEEPYGEPGYLASVRNYNRLVQLPPDQRLRRMQALRRFPVLVAPVLLTCHTGPSFRAAGRQAARKPDTQVERAIDAGQDLIGALARHWGISRGLVRSPVNAQWWSCDRRLRRAFLALLDALPANKRPASTEEWIRYRGDLLSYCYLLADGPIVEALERTPALVHKRALSDGFTASFERIARLNRGQPFALRDCQDFLRTVALRGADLVRAHHPLDNARLTQAWLMTHGLPRLVLASMRWHAQPLDAHDDGVTLPAIVGEWKAGPFLAVELLTRSAFAVEGREMRHCVADYFFYAEDGDRTFSLRGDDGERGTAHYEEQHDKEGIPYRLTQLRGRMNAECSPALERFAEALEAEINRPERAAARERASSFIENDPEADAQAGRRPPARARRLDPKSERQLRATLATMGLLPRGNERLLCATVAGLLYHDGPEVLGRLRTGDELALVREPDNPHDALAARIDWRGYRLGYIPRACNQAVAAALDAGEALATRIVHLDPEGPMWRRVEFVVDRAG